MRELLLKGLSLILNRGVFMIDLFLFLIGFIVGFLLARDKPCSDCGYIVACAVCSKEYAAIDRKLRKLKK